MASSCSTAAALPLPIGRCAYPSQTWRIMSTTTSVGRCAPSRADTGRLMRQLRARPPRQPRRDRLLRNASFRDAAVANRKERRVLKILPLAGRKPTLAGSGEGQPQQTIMSIRTSLRDYACSAVALLALLSGVETTLGQQEKEIDVWMAAPSDLSLAVTQVAPVLAVEQVAPTDSALTSTEQGQTPLDESFEFRQWRLEKRRQ